MPGRVTKENLDKVLTYQVPNTETVPKFQAINAAAKQFIEVILDNCPDCADRSAAIRKVREARMDANSSIALNGEV